MNKKDQKAVKVAKQLILDAMLPLMDNDITNKDSLDKLQKALDLLNTL